MLGENGCRELILLFVIFHFSMFGGLECVLSLSPFLWRIVEENRCRVECFAPGFDGKRMRMRLTLFPFPSPCRCGETGGRRWGIGQSRGEITSELSIFHLSVSLKSFEFVDCGFNVDSSISYAIFVNVSVSAFELRYRNSVDSPLPSTDPASSLRYNLDLQN